MHHLGSGGFRLAATAWAAAASGCVWVNEDAGRLDQDDDGFPVHVDCNDLKDTITTLEQWEGALTCGESVLADIVEGEDRLRIVNCIHPVQRDDLVLLGEREQVYRFSSDVATDVVLTLHTDAFLLHIDDHDTAGIALVVNRGDACELDTCDVALPIAPLAYRQAGDLAARESWDPKLSFHAEAGEGWFVVVSGGRGGASSPYTLEVACSQ